MWVLVLLMLKRTIVHISTCAVMAYSSESQFQILVTTTLMSDGTIWRTDDATSDWTEIPGPPEPTVGQVTVTSPTESEIPE